MWTEALTGAIQQEEGKVGFEEKASMLSSTKVYTSSYTWDCSFAPFCAKYSMLLVLSL